MLWPFTDDVLIKKLMKKVIDEDVGKEYIVQIVIDNGANYKTAGEDICKFPGKLTDKSDVYAFGVILLELLMGRKAVEKMTPTQCQSIVTWAMPQLTDRSMLPSIVDPVIKNTMDLKHLFQVAAVAVLCVQPEPSYRPLITDVLHSLVPLVPVDLGGTLRVSESVGKLTDKSDVYAFGVILLELLMGRKAVEKMTPTQCQSIVTWAMPQLTDRSMLPSIVDPVIKNTMDLKHLFQVAAVAVLCVQPEPSYRPLITDVLHSLVPLVPVDLGGTLRVSESVGPQSV
ncbi:Receptor-like kinase lip2 [Thalictrum thalictroides]|uniref:Receptor-like kinase lip2 n=1 Tax=Thalictrum thalictroides TaxID=46969 RepID=A0A7J6WWJ4_THATH|nr:Receptor-like kinase lip2 [Thalictrum thalictroides]